MQRESQSTKGNSEHEANPPSILTTGSVVSLLASRAAEKVQMDVNAFRGQFMRQILTLIEAVWDTSHSEEAVQTLLGEIAKDDAVLKRIIGFHNTRLAEFTMRNGGTMPRDNVTLMTSSGTAGFGKTNMETIQKWAATLNTAIPEQLWLLDLDRECIAQLTGIETLQKPHDSQRVQFVGCVPFDIVQGHIEHCGLEAVEAMNLNPRERERNFGRITSTRWFSLLAEQLACHALFTDFEQDDGGCKEVGRIFEQIATNDDNCLDTTLVQYNGRIRQKVETGANANALPEAAPIGKENEGAFLQRPDGFVFASKEHLHEWLGLMWKQLSQRLEVIQAEHTAANALCTNFLVAPINSKLEKMEVRETFEAAEETGAETS